MNWDKLAEALYWRMRLRPIPKRFLGDELLDSEDGAKLLSWLKEQAAILGCEQIHLDSGTQRKDAHRFYEREGMSRAGFHFVENVAPNKALQRDAPQAARP